MPAPQPCRVPSEFCRSRDPGCPRSEGKLKTGFKLARGQVITRARDSRNPGPRPALRARATNDSGAAGIFSGPPGSFSGPPQPLSGPGVFLGPVAAARARRGFSRARRSCSRARGILSRARRALLSGRVRRIHAPKLSLSAAKPAPVKITGISGVDSERTSGLLLICRVVILSSRARLGPVNHDHGRFTGPAEPSKLANSQFRALQLMIVCVGPGQIEPRLR